MFSAEEYFKKMMNQHNNRVPNKCKNCPNTYTKGVSFGQGEPPIQMKHCRSLDFLVEMQNYTNEFKFMHYDDTKGHYFECPLHTDSDPYLRLDRINEVKAGKDFSKEGDIPIAGGISSIAEFEKMASGDFSALGHYPNSHVLSVSKGESTEEVDDIIKWIYEKIGDNSDGGLGF